MSNLHSNEHIALRFLLTDDIYIVDKKTENPLPKQENVDIDVQSEVLVREEKISQTAAPQIETITPKMDVAEAKKSKEFSYIGENNKYFLILIDDIANKEISQTQQETLLKIMGAKGLELRDLAILNLNSFPGTNISELKDFFQCSKLVLFGINPQQISLPSIGANRVENHHNIKLFSTFGIDEMINDVNKKKEFWAIMKDF